VKYTHNQKVVLTSQNQLLQQTQQLLPALIHSAVATPDGLVLRTSASSLRPLAFFIRNHTAFQFRAVVDIAVVDRLLTPGRFAVNYLFLSVPLNQRLSIQLFAHETASIPTLTAPFVTPQQRLFASAA